MLAKGQHNDLYVVRPKASVQALARKFTAFCLAVSHPCAAAILEGCYNIQIAITDGLIQPTVPNNRQFVITEVCYNY